MRKLCLLSTLVLTTLFCSRVSAQDFSNKGTDFWVGYGYHQIMTAGNQQQMVLYFAADQAANVNVSIPSLGYSQNYVVPANSLITSNVIPKGAPQDARLLTEGKSGKGIHITSDYPIVAYAHIYNNSVSGATILYPTNTLGREYYSINFTNISNTADANCWFYVVATDTGTTTVEITPSSNTTGGWSAGSTYSVTLTQGEIYNVMGQYSNTAGGGAGVDLTGSLIKSINTGSGCKKIGVFSGSGRIAITCPLGASSSDNYMVQAVPKPAWGKKYVTTPTQVYIPASNSYLTQHNYYRICVSDPTTVVTVNGSPIGVPLQNNFYYELDATSSFSQFLDITADKPIMVAQYLTSQNSCSNGSPGDPEVIYLSSVEQNINLVRWNATPNFAISQHHINIVIPNGGTAISSFLLKDAIGNVLPHGNFITHPQDPNFSYLLQRLPNAGVYSIESDSGFNAIAYGLGSAESYGYNAGTNIRDLNQGLEVSSQWSIESAPNSCTNSPFTFKVYFPDQSLASPPVPIRYDSIRWDCSNTSVMIPNNFPYVQYGSPQVPPDSVNIRNGKTVAWYSVPGSYSFTTPGTYIITITVYRTSTEGCGNEQQYTFPLTITAPPVATFNAIAPGCYLEQAQFFETTSQVPKATYHFWWDFGDPASGASNNSGVRNPTHLFTGPGNFPIRFMNITTAGCLSDTTQGSIDIPDIPDGTISGAATVCINTSPVDITFTGSGGKAPYTFTYTVNAGPPQTIATTGVNTSVTLPVNPVTAGTFRYTLTQVKNTGSSVCLRPLNSFIDLVVQADATVTLSSAPGTDNQTKCINTPITNITYTVGGSGTGGSVTGLPAGVTGTFAGGVITITGTPTAPGVFNYTVNTTGPCLTPSVTGTITVTDNTTISLSSAAGTDNQTICINTPLSAITYTVGGSGTGGNVTGLPAGVTGTFAGGVITISGSPSVAGTFNYTVNTTGPCINPTMTGTITVTPDGVINLSSAPGTDNQTRCINTAITTITYTTGGSTTGGSVSGLPPGVNGVYAGGVITISGTPNAVGAYNYTVTTTGPCSNPQRTGTITVNPDATINLTSAPPTTNQEFCFNNPLTPITYAVGGGGSGATVTGLPAGVTGTFAGGTVTISGIPTVSGVFNYTVTTTGICVQATATGTITINALPTASFVPPVPSCETRTITFNDNSTPNSGTIINWAWNFGDPASGPLNTSTLQNPTHTFSTAGNYTITLVVTTDKGCVSTNPPVNITVNVRPQAGFIVPDVCINDVATLFTDTSHISSGSFDPAGYYWDFGDPASGPLNTSTAQNGSHLYTAIGPYNVMHVVTSSLGCKDTVYNTIFINAADPVADFTVNNSATLCANDSVAITNISTISQGSVTRLEIYWDLVGAPGTFQTISSPVFNAVYKHKYPTQTTTQVYTIRMIAYSGTICFSNKTVNVTVNAAPSVRFNPMPNICYDAAPYQIPPAIAAETGGVPGNGVFTGPGVSPGGLFNPVTAGIGTHRILYTFTSTAGGCVDTASNLITVWDTASARIGVQPLACEKSPVNFNSTASSIPAGNGSINGWNWNFGDPASGAQNTSTVASPVHLFTGYGTYTVTLTVNTSNGCRSTPNTMQVTVNPIARPDFSVPPISCLPNANVTFTNLSTIPLNTPASLTYFWDFGDPASGPVNNSTGVNPSHTYTTVGPFNVKLQATSAEGCVHDTTIIINSIHPEPTGSFTADKVDVCIGGSFTFNSTSDPKDGTITSWSWDLADGGTRTVPSFTYTYGAIGTYDVTHFIINSFGCKSSVATTTVSVNPYPVVDAGPRKYMLEGGAVELTPIVNVTYPVTYSWHPGIYLNDSTLSNPIARPPDDQYFTMVVTSNKGCSSSDTMFVKVLKMPGIPNIFSPNGDGIHDTWEIQYLDTYPGCTVDIVNRYGQLVYHSTGYPKPWDGKVNGKDAPVGTYYYVIDPKNGRKPVTGYVDIIR